MIKREVGLGIWKRGDSSPSTHEHHKLQVLGESPLSHVRTMRVWSEAGFDSFLGSPRIVPSCAGFRLELDMPRETLGWEWNDLTWFQMNDLVREIEKMTFRSTTTEKQAINCGDIQTAILFQDQDQCLPLPRFKFFGHRKLFCLWTSTCI